MRGRRRCWCTRACTRASASCCWRPWRAAAPWPLPRPPRCPRPAAAAARCSTRSTWTAIAAAIARRAGRPRPPGICERGRARAAEFELGRGPRAPTARRVPGGAAVRTTVLMMSWDEAQLLRHSLPRRDGPEGADVIVVDNACSDDTAAVIAEHGAGGCACRRGCPTRPRSTRALTAIERRRRAAAERRLLPRARLPGRRAAAAGRAAAWARWLRSCCARAARAPSSGWTRSTPRAWSVDRRRKNTLVGHGRPALAYDRPAEAFGADGAARCTGARRSRTARLRRGGARRGHASAGPPTWTWPGAPGRWAGVRLRARGRWPTMCARYSPSTRAAMPGATGGCSSATAT